MLQLNNSIISIKVEGLRVFFMKCFNFTKNQFHLTFFVMLFTNEICPHYKIQSMLQKNKEDCIIQLFTQTLIRRQIKNFVYEVNFAKNNKIYLVVGSSDIVRNFPCDNFYFSTCNMCTESKSLFQSSRMTVLPSLCKYHTYVN